MSSKQSYFQSLREKVHQSEENGTTTEQSNADLLLQAKEAAKRWSQTRGTLSTHAPAQDSLLSPTVNTGSEARWCKLNSVSNISESTSLHSVDSFYPNERAIRGPFSPPIVESASNLFQGVGTGSIETPSKNNIAQQSKLKQELSEPSSGVEAQQRASSSPKLTTWHSRLLSWTGISTLSAHERVALQGVFLATPMLLVLLDFSTTPDVSQATTDTVTSSTTWKVWAELRTMSRLDVTAAVALGVLLSFTWDKNTRTTDRVVAAAVNRCVTWMKDKCGGSAPRVVSDTVEILRQESTSGQWAPSANVTRLAVVAVLLGYGTKVTATALTLYTLQLTRQYGWIAIAATATVLALYVAYVLLQWYLRRQSVRAEIIDVLTTMTKTLIAQKARAYPIAYLYEELGDNVKMLQMGMGEFTVFSPSARCQMPGSDVGTAGAVGAVPTTAANVVGGVSFLGGMLGSPAPAVIADPVPAATAAPTPLTPGTAATVLSMTGPRDILHGHRLPSLWGEVQRSVQRDSRIQRLDMIVDGRKQACWRVLGASTNAKI